MRKDFIKSYGHILLPSLFILVVHFINNAFTTYGIFRDELYYIACSEHLAWGYVDQPPFCAFILLISRTIFGESLFALRLLPSIAHASTVFLTGITTKKLGGEKYAQFLSATAVALAPGIVGITAIYSMNAFDILLWQIVIYFLIRLFETQNSTYWIWIGITIGFGLLNKISMGWLAAGLAVGILATPQRRCLKKTQPWDAAAIALLMFLPYIIWNVQHDFAHLEFAGNAARMKYASQNPITFISGLVILYNPFAVPIWAAGFWILVRHKQKEFRVIGIAIFTVLLILLVNFNSKSEYFNPAATILLAAGVIQVERWLKMRIFYFRYGYVLILIISGFLMMPMAVDILPLDTFIRYSQSVGIGPPNTEGHEMGNLPQHYADKFGWKELADDVADVYNRLTFEEKKHAMIYAQNYGEAGAIDFYGEKFDLPPVMCGHNNYWIWGKESITDTIEVLIAVGGEADDYTNTFAEITHVKTHTSQFAMRYENNLPIFICRKPKLKIKAVWHTTKNYI